MITYEEFCRKQGLAVAAFIEHFANRRKMVETYDNGVIKESIDIPPDFTVFVVVQGHDYEGAFASEKELGDLMMPEVYEHEEDARKHWRFTAPWIPEPEKQAARVEKTTYGDWVKRVGMTVDGKINMANPFDGLHYAEMKAKYWTKHERL